MAAVTTTVKIDIEAVRKATKSAIQSFLSQRANMIASMGPDTGQMHNKLTGPCSAGGPDNDQPSGLGGPADQEARVHRAPGQPGPQSTGLGMREALSGDRDAMAREAAGTRRDRREPLGFSGAAEDGQGRFAFATSLTQVRAAATAEQAQKEAAAGQPEDMMGLGARGASGRPRPHSPGSTRGPRAYSPTTARTASTGSARATPGFSSPAPTTSCIRPADRRARADRLDRRVHLPLGRNADGRGWMAGPYVSARLTQNLYFDARALWGRSSNHIDPLGAYTDSFEGNRALASAKLTGRWAFGGLTFQPSAELIYFTEEQEAYRTPSASPSTASPSDWVG